MTSITVVKLPCDEEAKVTKLKVKEGNVVYDGRIMLLYEVNSSKEIKKLKASQVGTVRRVLVKEGDILLPRCEILELEKGCSHPTVINDLCAECGLDLQMEETQDRLNQASVSMIHSVPQLKVSQEQARIIGKADEARLLRDRKLVLLVDLDQTLIHTTNDDIPNNVEGIYHFQLYGHISPWHHTRLRPGTHAFLNNISKIYELHICTFGSRNYAHTIAKFLDPEGIFFSHRILSRDECFNANSKTANLKALFPCGENLVCIIDDREDVWEYAPNLIHVKPYVCFNHTGDINAPPGLAKRENDNCGAQSYWVPGIRVKKKEPERGYFDGLKHNGHHCDAEKHDGDHSDEERYDGDHSDEERHDRDHSDEERQNGDHSDDEKGDIGYSDEEKNGGDQSENKDIGCHSDVEKHGGGYGDEDKHSGGRNDGGKDVRDHSDKKKDIGGHIDKKKDGGHIDEKRNDGDRSDEENDKRGRKCEEKDNEGCSDEEKPGEDRTENPQKIRVQDGIGKSEDNVHVENFSEKPVVTRNDTRAISEEKNEIERLLKCNNLNAPAVGVVNGEDERYVLEDADDYLLYLEEILRHIHWEFFKRYDEENVMPNLKEVIPETRGVVLQGVNIVFSGIVASHVKLEDTRAYKVATSLGAKVTQNIQKDTTHIVAVRMGTAKVHTAHRRSDIHVVNPDWLWMCAERWEKVDERLFPLENAHVNSRHPPAHCSSPEHTPPHVPAALKQSVPKNFIESIPPLMSFSVDDIADMEGEVDDIFNDSSESEAEEGKRKVGQKRMKTDSDASDSDENDKKKNRLWEETEDIEDDDEFFGDVEMAESDENSSQDDDLNIMGAELEKEFLDS